MAYESELEAELEDEFEGELEDETEDELEGEDFLGSILGEGEDFLGDILGEGEDFLGDILGEGEEEGFLGSILGEGEDESEDEYEEEISPIRKIYPDAVMEHLGELAAESESEDEAVEHFLPLVGMAASKLLPVVAKAIAPMAKRALPKIAKVVTRATPHLTKVIAKVAKTLHRNPQTRHLLKAVPSIARRTVGRIAHHVARGGRVTPGTAARALVKQTRRVLGTPGHRAQALRHHNRLERKFHRRMGRGIAHPHLRYGRHYGRGFRARGGMVPGSVGRRGAISVGRPGVGARGARYGRTVGGGGGCPSCTGCCQCCGQRVR